MSQFCGYCGAKTVPVEAGRKKECSNDSCKRRIYPRVDTVVMRFTCGFLDFLVLLAFGVCVIKFHFFRISFCGEQVVIMLVIDKENDRALLSRQSRFVPRMWSCLAGFIEVHLSLYFGFAVPS